jgi:epoxyqueuosine reductase
LRNAAIVLGNQRATAALPALLRGLQDAEPLVRGACAWALGRIGGDETMAALQQHAALESDPLVQDELSAALTADDLH